MGDGQIRLLDQARDRIRRKHYSMRTEQAYVDWIRRFVLHHNKRHPCDMGAAEVEGFLTHLAVAKRVSASTQNQAKSAVLFLYKEVLGEPLPWLESIESAKRPARLPVVLTRAGGRIDPGTSERHGGIDDPAPLRDRHADYGVCAPAGEGCRFRAWRDRGSAGQGREGPHDHAAADPRGPAQRPSRRVRKLHEADLESGYGEVYLPDALARKYPGAPRQWAWQYVFPSRTRSVDPRSGAGGTLRTRRPCSVRCSRPCGGRASPNWPRPIPCDIRSPPTSCNRATTSGWCRSSSATRTCRPRRSTRMS